MTTIAYKDGVLAADTITIQSGTKFYGRSKILRRPDGVLIASAGSCAWGDAFRQWALDGCKGNPPCIHEKDTDGGTGMVITPDGVLTIWNTDAGGVLPMRFKPPYYATGTGMDLAMGAMFMGASADMAVRAAVHHDSNTGGDVTVLRHKLPQE